MACFEAGGHGLAGEAAAALGERCRAFAQDHGGKAEVVGHHHVARTAFGEEGEVNGGAAVRDRDDADVRGVGKVLEFVRKDGDADAEAGGDAFDLATDRAGVAVNKHADEGSGILQEGITSLMREMLVGVMLSGRWEAVKRRRTGG